MLNKLKNNPKVNFILIIGGVLLAGTFFYLQAIVPFISKWKDQTKQIQIKQKLIEKSQAALGERETLDKKFAFLSDRVQAKIPTEREESQFLTEIGNVAEETSIHIETMNPLPIRELGEFNELSVEINMEANLGNLIRFLYKMRESSVVLVANRLKLQPKSERSALLKAHLVISTIFMKK